VLLDRPMKEDIPAHDFYYPYYGDARHKLKVYPNYHMENANSPRYLTAVKASVLENLRQLEHAPGVAMHQLPPDHLLPQLDDDERPDARYGRWGRDREVQRDDEFMAGDG
jgi:histone deacetylase 1/2